MDSLLSGPPDEQHHQHAPFLFRSSSPRDHLMSEFNRWVEGLLSRYELPLGSAVPAMKHPQPRRGSKTKTKAKAKAKAQAQAQMKTLREEDQSSAPAAPAPEDRRPAPAASTPEEDLPEDGDGKAEQAASAVTGH